MASRGCDWLLPPPTATSSFYLRDIILCVSVYSMCMRATIVYVYLCDCIGIFECEAHFNMIIVPASVCAGLRGDGGLYLFHSQEGFHGGRGGGGGGDGDSPGASESVGSVQSRCRPEPRLKLGWKGGLFDDLRTVAPGFGLSLGQSQPCRLCGHLWRVTGGEAL